MTRIVTLDQLVLEHPHFKNPRTLTGLSDKELDALGEDLIDRGQKVPLVVAQILNDDDTISNLVIDGQRRCLALRRVCRARKKGQQEMELKVHDHFVDADGNPIAVRLDPEQADLTLLDALALGLKRKGLSSFEQTEVAIGIRDRHPEWTMDRVGQAIERSESWVSKMIKARSKATPELCKAWGEGKLTDEQFKELASITSTEDQVDALKQAIALRSDGDRKSIAEARRKTKQASAKAEAASGKKPKKKARKLGNAQKVMNNPHLYDIIQLAKKERPTDPYVKGIVHAAQYAQGELDAADFGPAWRQYLSKCVKDGVLEASE